MMLTEQDFIEWVEDLRSDDPAWRAVTLRTLWDMPTGDARILPYVEQLLYDKTPCVLGLPYIFGEIRWLAAKALAAERKTQGISTPVHVQNVVQPIYSSIITAAEEAAGLEYKPGIEGILENFWILRDMGYLPRIDMDILPLLDSPSPTPTPETAPALPIEQKSPQLALVPAI